ncbi:MAG: HAMP domain-containing protein [Chloroflexi bacterium]|nr:MAG: HAMP domain-containing protein [Chloroflexota bacterium]
MTNIRQEWRTPFAQLAPQRERFWSWAGGVSVRTKILGIVLALTAILGLGVTWQVRLVMSRVFVAELEQRGLSVVSDLAGRVIDPILLNDTFAVHELLIDTVVNHPDALYAFVVAPSGDVIAHTFGDSGFPLALLGVQPTAYDTADEAHRHIQHTTYRSEQGMVHDFSAPIFEGRSGVVRLGLTETRLTGIINAMTGQMLLTTLVVALAGIAAATFLTWLLTRPILALVETTHLVGQGDLKARAPHWADDEIGALADAFNQMAVNLETSRQAIAEKDIARTQLLEQLITAQEEERKRIARELHDGVGQALTSLIVGMKVAGQLESTAEMRGKSEEMRLFATETLDQVRLLSRQLRPSVLDDLGLTAALERYADEFGRLHSHISVDLHLNLPERLPPLVETTLYRIVQEAMTNAARHSNGDTVSVLLSRHDDRVRAIVEDNGNGFDVEGARRAGRSVGLYGMTERAELVGGYLEVESSGDGTAVYVEVPA